MHVVAATKIGLAGVCEKAQSPESAVLKPLPVTETAVPLLPVLGLRIIVGPGTVTVKTPVAKSPLLPVTVTTYKPGVAPLETVKLLPVN